MRSITLPSAIIITLFLCVTSPLAAQQSGNQAQAPNSRHVYTNEDLERAHAEDGLPHGLLKCGKDVQCFLQALGRATPAALARTETAKEGTAVVFSTSTWWTTQFAADRCTVSFRVDSMDAKVNEAVVPPGARDAAEDKLAEMKRDFESVRGKTGTCSLAIKDLKAMMTSSSWSLMALSSASNFGKNCSGPAFDASPSSPFDGKNAAPK